MKEVETNCSRGVLEYCVNFSLLTDIYWQIFKPKVEVTYLQIPSLQFHQLQIYGEGK